LGGSAGTGGSSGAGTDGGPGGVAGTGGSSGKGGMAGVGGSAGTGGSGGKGGFAGSGGIGGFGGFAGTIGTGGNAGSSGTGGSAGAGGTGGRPDAGLPPCGIGLPLCDKDAFCDFDNDDDDVMCGLGKGAEGVCRPRPTACPTDCPGVCGCDTRFYCNTCVAHQAGVDDSDDESCKRPPDAGPGTDCTTDQDCRLGLLCCNASGPGNQRTCMMPTSKGDCP